MAARQTPPGARPNRTVRRLPAKVQVGRSDGWSFTTRSGLQACYGEGPLRRALASWPPRRLRPAMRFSIFYELQHPQPWEPGGEQRLLAEALEQVELADRLGFDGVCAVEHHFLGEVSHSPAPAAFLAAAPQRTQPLRLRLAAPPRPPRDPDPA